jgi:heme/copper-type cytochrome/quinol oxidase subunit 2
LAQRFRTTTCIAALALFAAYHFLRFYLGLTWTIVIAILVVLLVIIAMAVRIARAVARAEASRDETARPDR